MARVFRQQYTRPVPEGAKRTTAKDREGREVPAVKFRGRDGRTVTGILVGDGTRCRVTSPTYYGRVNGEPVALTDNRTSSEALLARLLGDAREGGAVSSQHATRPVAEHVEDFHAHILAKGAGASHAGDTRARLLRLLEGIGAATLRQIDAGKAALWLAGQMQSAEPAALEEGKEGWKPKEVAALLGVTVGAVALTARRHGLQATGGGRARRYPRSAVHELARLQAMGVGPATVNHHVKSCRSFGRWLAGEGRRCARDPFASLKKVPEAGRLRRMRRDLTPGELARLLDAARASTRVFRGLDGPSRAALYRLACGTGFRAAALAAATPEDFELGGDDPAVTLWAVRNKSKKKRRHPLPLDVAEVMRAHLAGARPGARIWPGNWHRHFRCAEMLRGDLAEAGVPYRVDSPDGPLYADFHSLRHTYLTLGSLSGIDARTLQELAGHASPATTARYTHRRAEHLRAGVEKLPRLDGGGEVREDVRGGQAPAADTYALVLAVARAALTAAVSPDMQPAVTVALDALSDPAGAGAAAPGLLAVLRASVSQGPHAGAALASLEALRAAGGW